MSKCPICGKKFGTLVALEDHHKAVHHNVKFALPRNTTKRNLMVSLTIVMIVMGGLVGYLITSQPQSPSTHSSTTSGILGTTISAQLYQDMSGVSDSTLSVVASNQGSVTSPRSVSGSPPLTSGGKPELLYIGADYCPYCAAERWSLVVALSKFGTFSNLEYMLSGPHDLNVSTVSFYGSTYASQYISFVSVEETDRYGQVTLQTPTSNEQSIMQQYDAAGSIPFVSIASQYVVVGSQYSPNLLVGLNWSQIGSSLNNPSNPLAKNVDGAADTLITAICKTDGGNPGSICGQSFANLPLALVYSSPQVSPLSSSIHSAVSEVRRAENIE